MENKKNIYKIISIESYILIVDDSEIREGEWYINLKTLYIFMSDSKFDEGNNPNQRETNKKIIAYLPLNGTEALTGLPLLPPLEDEEDVDKLAEQKWKLVENTGKATANFKNGYGSGYHKAKEKYRFTQEDMIRMAIHCWNIASKPVYGATYDVNKIAEEYIKFLSQYKLPKAFECEMMYRVKSGTIQEHKEGKAGYEYYEPKTIISSEGQIIFCGKYIY